MRAWECLQDVDGYASAKRICIFIAVGMIAVSWIANVFFSIVTDPNILTALGAIGGINGFGVAAERFGKVFGNVETDRR